MKVAFKKLLECNDCGHSGHTFTLHKGRIYCRKCWNRKKPSGEITLRYSDRYSHKFWGAVNSLDDPAHMKAYEMGCKLQNLEYDVVLFVNTALVVKQRKEAK